MSTMKNTEYYKSGRHLQNVQAANDAARIATQKYKIERIAEYDKFPTLCANCLTAIPYSKKQNKFCCKSCAGMFNNRIRHESGWTRSEESRKQTSISAKKFFAQLTSEEKALRKVSKPVRPKNPEVEFTCPHCNTTKMIPYIKRRMKTCGSDDCKIYASVGIRNYKNGRRIITWLYNPYEDKEVLLESSWEVTIAKLLIEKKIEWIRPKFIKWIDATGITRRYFPDFYLPKFDMYLDPKNAWGMANSKAKMLAVSNKINIVYGELQLVEDYINSLT